MFRIFRLEPHKVCKYDHVDLLDGPDDSAPLIGRHCGDKRPPLTTSSSTNITVTFFSDTSVQRKGFKIRYKTVCGGTLKATPDVQHFVSHPNFGLRKYNKNENCTWSIEAPAGQKVLLDFDSFDIEDDCKFDNVTIINGQREIVKCGSHAPRSVTSVGHQLLVHFRSDHTLQHEGFRATYRVAGGSVAPPGGLETVPERVDQTGQEQSVYTDLSRPRFDQR